MKCISVVAKNLRTCPHQRRYLVALILTSVAGFSTVMIYAARYSPAVHKLSVSPRLHGDTSRGTTLPRKVTTRQSSTPALESGFKPTTARKHLPTQTVNATTAVTAAHSSTDWNVSQVTSSTAAMSFSSATSSATLNVSRIFKMDEKLLQEYLKQLSEITPHPRNYRNISCPLTLTDKLKNGSPCVDVNCSAEFPVPAERLRIMLESQDVVSAQSAAIIASLANETQRADFIFLTAASSNHYGETQATLKGLQEIVFPMLRQHFPGSTTRLVYFDLGLRKMQTDLLRKYGQCDVVRFPFEKLPPYFRKLGTCSWKPLLLKAYLKYSRLTVWMDASTRILEKSTHAFLSVVQRALSDGMVISRNQNMLARHVAPPMLSYFRMQACQLAPFYELAGGFVAMKNDTFVERVILDSWVACAFSNSCLCPGEDCQKLYNGCFDKDKLYSRCHRFDQSAIAVILANLFHYKSSHFVVDGAKGFSFNRGHKIEYLPTNL